MEGVPALRQLIQKDDYTVKIDLKDAYVVVPMHPQSRKYLSFKHRGIIYRYTSLVFGMSSSPLVFAKLTRFALESLRQQGIRLTNYLEDTCVLGRSRQECIDHATKTKDKVGAITHPGIPRLSIQYEHHEDQCTIAEDEETDFQNSPTPEDTSKVQLQMDRSHHREDDRDDSSNRACSPESSVHPERPILQPQAAELQLGKPLLTVSESIGEPALVGDHSKPEERTTDSNNYARRRPHYPSRRLRQWMGSSINSCTDIGVLDSQRKRTFDQCTGVTDDQIRTSAPCKRLCMEAALDLHRQHDSAEVCMEIGWDSIDHAAGPSVRHSSNYPEIQLDSQVQTYCRDSQHNSRSSQSGAEAALRMETPSTFLQPSTGHMGQTTTGCFRQQGEPPITEILELSSGSRSPSDRRLSTILADEGSVLAPTMAVNPSSDSQAQGGSSEGGSTDHPILANPILVADGNATSDSATNSITSVKTVELDRLAVIRAFQQSTLSITTMDYLQGANGAATHKNYDQLWKQLALWCHRHGRSAVEYDPFRVVEYLMTKEALAYATLNTIRSAIASVFRIIHPTKPPLASHPAIIGFFKAKQRRSLKLPNIHDETFDIQLVTDHVLSWGPTATLPIGQLQLKTLYLLTVATIWRPRSDLGKLQFRDLSFTPAGLTVIARQPKEGRPKASKVGRVANGETCPVATMETFIKKTNNFRSDLAPDHTLFLANLESTNPVKSIAPATSAAWLQKLMHVSGVNTTKFTAHSLRSASSTKAVLLGIAKDTVKTHANWSLQANTFEKYYFKPLNQHAQGAEINSKIFDTATENRTTSGVGVEATTIVVGTTHNGNVAETQTTDVVAPNPV